LPKWFWLLFLAAYGGCVGSFLNVVIYRLPEGKGLVTPRSSCPKCGHPLAWYDNVPVLGWLWLRGKCRYCKAPISIQYPLVEAAVAVMFAGLYALYYMTLLRPDFFRSGFGVTWPIYVVHVVLLSGLFASTVIDARLYIIPRSIPWTVTVLAVLILPLAVWYDTSVQEHWQLFNRHMVPIAYASGVTTAAGAFIGLGISLLLLKLKILPLSFADYEQAYEEHLKANSEADQDGGEDWFHYPHPRREVLKELLFLVLPIVGAVVGYLFRPVGQVDWPAWVFVLGGVGLGYLMGAALVWGTRILGTLAFGKEAMGLGDVHLLAAIGAVMGPGEVIPVFFIAPFFGLVAAVLMFGLGAMLKKRFQPIPYGPYLAGAAVVVLIWREPIIAYLEPLLKIFDILFIV